MNLLSAAGLIIAPLLLAALGFVSLIRSVSRSEERAGFANTFRNKFIQWANSQGRDGELYQWIIMNSNEMQGNLGSSGIIRHFSTPFSSVVYDKYAIILNLIPLANTSIQNADGFSRLETQLINNYIRMVDECLLRYIGSLDVEVRQIRDDFRNPLVWVRRGVEGVAGALLEVFAAFGLIHSQTILSVLSSSVFRLVSGIVSLAACVTSVVGIVVNWEATVQGVVRLWAAL